MNLPWAMESQMLAPISRPVGGAQWSLYQNTYSRICPSQNTGSETPIRANTIPDRSQIEPRLTPETIPMGMPISSQMTALPSASVTVTGRRRIRSSLTGTKLE